MRLTTTSEACGLLLCETLVKMLEWVVERIREGLSMAEVKHQLALPSHEAVLCKIKIIVPGYSSS